MTAGRAGLDSAELISELRAAHASDDTKLGVDVVLGKAGDMSELGIFECYRVRTVPRAFHLRSRTITLYLLPAVQFHCRLSRSLVTYCLYLTQVKEQIILSATEAAEMILRVDDIIKCAPRQRAEE